MYEMLFIIIFLIMIPSLLLQKLESGFKKYCYPPLIDQVNAK